MNIDNKEKIPEDAQNFKAPVDINPQIDNLDITSDSKIEFSDSSIENIIIERRVSKAKGIENHLAEIKEKIEEVSQKQWSCKTFAERKLIEDQVRELGEEASDLEHELTKVNDENRQPIRPDEINKVKLELETAREKEKQVVDGEPTEQKAEHKVEDFIREIRDSEKTLEEKEKIVKERLKGMQDERSIVKPELKADFETLRLFFVEIIGQKPKDTKVDNESKADQLKGEKPDVKAETVKTEIVEPMQEIVITDKKPEATEAKREKVETTPKKEEKILMPDEIKAKREEMKKERERLKAEREEQERKRRLLVEFVKNNEEEFKQIWFNLREKGNKLFNIETIVRKEKEQINRILAQSRIENVAFDLKLDFLKNESLMNNEKKDIIHILKEDGLSKDNIEMVKTILRELVEKYEGYKTEIARKDKNRTMTTGLMNSVFRELKDKDIFEAVPEHNKEAEAVSGEEFENLDETIKKTEKELEAEIAKLKLFPAEAK